jgi:hypothetical protein
MPRFVILLHECPPRYHRPTHYDLMLEDGQSLRTWALDEQLAAGVAVAAERLSDHRLDYLDFQGPLSDDRGSVSQWDSGTFDWQQDTQESIEVRLRGTRLQGNLRLVPTDSDTHRWRVDFAPDCSAI